MQQISEFAIQDVQEKLMPIFRAMIQQVQQDFEVLVGSPLNVSNIEIPFVPREEYLRSKFAPCLYSDISIDQDYSGLMHLVFSKPFGIAISGLLVMIDENTIKEKLRTLTFDEGDKDAFAEIMNQLIGSIMTALQRVLPNKIHLNRENVEEFSVQDGAAKMESIFSEESYFMGKATIKTGNFDEDVFELLMPVSVAAQFAGLDLKEIEGRSKKMPILYLFEKEEQVGMVKPRLEESGLYLIPHYFKKVKVNPRQFEEARAVWIDVDQNVNQAITICKNIKLKYPHKKVILSSSNWTKARAIMAVQFGADDIIVKPFPRDLVTSRILPEIQV